MIEIRESVISELVALAILRRRQANEVIRLDGSPEEAKDHFARREKILADAFALEDAAAILVELRRECSGCPRIDRDLERPPTAGSAPQPICNRVQAICNSVPGPIPENHENGGQ